jgi:hypothetical protein
MTRREWLQKNPPPQSAGPLLDRATELEAQGKAQEAATIRAQASAAPAKCPLHPGSVLYRHQNRQEDLFVCKQGPHFLLWTLVGARAQLVPLTVLKDLPEIDAPMPGV